MSFYTYSFHCGTTNNNFSCYSKHGIPVKDNKGDKYIISIGIIDIMTEYTNARLIESIYKKCMNRGNATIIAPKPYADRLRHFITTIILKKDSVKA